MSTREALIEQGVAAILPLYIAEDQAPNAFDYVLVGAVLDAILPQVTTVDELGELPANTKLLDSDGAAWELRHNGFDHGGPWLKGTTGAHQHYSVHVFLPLTIVWRPS